MNRGLIEMESKKWPSQEAFIINRQRNKDLRNG